MFGLLRLCIFGDVWVYIYVMGVHVYCKQVNYFRTVVPFRRPYYRTSHCYSELSGDYWDKLSHSTITDIFAGIHAQAQASGKGIRFQRLFRLVSCVYCQFV